MKTLYTCNSGVALNKDFRTCFHASDIPNHQNGLKYKFIVHESQTEKIGYSNTFNHIVNISTELKFTEIGSESK